MITTLALAIATIVARILAAAILVACVLVLIALVRHDLPLWRAAKACRCGSSHHHPSCPLRGVA